jgi:phasin family protein
MPASTKDIRDRNIESIESAREGARQLADTARQAAEATQETVRAAIDTASQTFQRSADQFARSFGFSGQQGEELARQSTRNLEAMTECGTILLRGFQEISREWMSLGQRRLQKNLENIQTLAACQSVQDLVATQTELVRDNMQDMVDNSRHIAERSVEVANEAAQTLTKPTKSASRRLPHAA